MTPQIITTSNGTHSADQWAYATAKMIFDITPDMQKDRFIQASKVQLGIAEVLRELFDTKLNQERTDLAVDENHCDTAYNASIDSDKKFLNKLLCVLSSSPWETLLKTDEWIDHALLNIANQIRSAFHVERLWYGDTHPTNKSAIEYKRRFNLLPRE